MLTAENNKLLCDVSPGAPMHEAFKHYWLPVMRSARLEAGGAPEKFTILCEDYVAFRAHNGQVGVFAEKCPHRACSLALANNRDDSLICLFHGWKFHVSGKCIETPNEANPEFPSTVPLKSYPAREAGGMVWAYFGAGDAPRFPDLIFNVLPAENVLARSAYLNYNWLTGIEAILDPSHVGSLHRNWAAGAPGGATSPDIIKQANDTAPVLEIEPTDWGFRYAAMRDGGDDKMYLRVTEYVAPSGCFIAQSVPTRKLFIMSVPIDNTRSIQWYVWYNPIGKLEGNDRAYALGKTDDDHDNFFASAQGKPMWGQDRAAMTRGENFTGFYDIMFEDFVVGESQGAIPDRTTEFLGRADLAIMRVRRLFLSQLNAYCEGDKSAFGHKGDFRFEAIQSVGTLVDKDADWRKVAEAEMTKRTTDLALD